MEEGINGYEVTDDFDDYESGLNDAEFVDSGEYQESSEESSEELYYERSDEEIDLIDKILETRGISDKSRIKFEDENGDIVETDWNTLSIDEQILLINNANDDPDVDLDPEEIQLINTIRNSRLSPEEFIRYLQHAGVLQYLNSQQSEFSHTVDDYTDDELYVADAISRKQMSEDEAIESLKHAKKNSTLFEKEVNSLRSEYKRLEDDDIQQKLYAQQQAAQLQYNQFANAIQDEIYQFNEFCGYDLNMDEEDMSELYEFITGFDSAGTSILGKAINDPATLVKMSWLALHGEDMINDIEEYYKKEITNVRKASYAKGKEDALSGRDNKIVQKKSSKSYKNNLNEDW